jgi:transcriptional regulator with XRE-family HTH domain
MTNIKEIIIELKKVREEKGLSYNDILDLMEENGDYLSKSTLSRVFADGSEEVSFRYEETIRPIANALLDIERIEDDDTLDTRAMKSLLKYKADKIEELERKLEQMELVLAEEKNKYHEKIDKEREQSRRSIEFLKEQISLKDKRMDMLLDAVFTKDAQHKELLDTILSCPTRKAGDC